MKRFLRLITNMMADHNIYGDQIEYITDGEVYMSWFDFVMQCNDSTNEGKSPNKNLIFMGENWWISCEYSIRSGQHWVFHSKPHFPALLYYPEQLKLTDTRTD